MKILIAGGTGFIGSNLVAALVADNHDITMLIRPGSKHISPRSLKTQAIIGDSGAPLNLEKKDFDAVINVVGIIREFPLQKITFKTAHYEVTKNLVDYARANKVEKFILMSALGVKRDGKTGYQKTKYDAEQYLINSRLSWTIIRPSMIFGPGDQSINFFAGLVRNLPVVPVIGDGNYRLQPVYIGDVCYAFKLALSDNSYSNRTLEFGGPEIFTYDQILDVIGKILGKAKVSKIHLPVPLMKLGASLFGWLKRFPLTNEQIAMLLEENYTDMESYERLFCRKPLNLSEGLVRYLK